MRYDLSQNFNSKCTAQSRKPRQLLVFHFPQAGDVYVSDQELGTADGLDNEYLPLVEEWGTLQDVIGSPTSHDPGIIKQLSITLWNGGKNPFSNYFKDDPPEMVEVSLYQWFMELADADKALIDRFVVQDPIEFSESSRLLQLDLVGLPIRWTKPVGKFLDRVEWPDAAPADIGRGIPYVLGSPGQVPGIKARVAKYCTLANSILSNDAVIPVNDNLDEKNFPSSGSIQIGEERIDYSARTASSFTGCTRGVAGTEKNQHIRNEEIVEHISNHTFLLCEGPIDSISNIKIDGFPAPTDIYTVDAAANPARVIFNQQPYYEKYSAGSRFLEMQFDAVASGNTAENPENAFDTDETATSAVIKASKPALKLLQNTANENRGQILKAYLSVAHWESGLMDGNRVKVNISGVGDIGTLAIPNTADDFSLDGDVDIDHGHLHSTGAAHYHTYTDPNFTSSSSPHNHSMTVDVVELACGIGSFPLGTWITKSGTSWTTDNISSTLYNNNQGVWVEYTLDWYTAYADPDIELHIAVGGTWRTIPLNASGGARIYIGNGTVGGSPYIRYRSTNSSLSTKFNLSSCSLIFHAINSIDDTGVAVSTSKSAAGSVLGQGADNNDDPIKASDDVHDLVTGNKPLNINQQANPSRTIVDLFDVTEHVNFDWTWFTNRTVTLTYVDGTGTNRDVHVLHTFFGVEFAPKEIVFSDNVTAEPISTINSAAAAVKDLLTNKAGVSEAQISSSFDSITSNHAGLGYTLNGLIDASLSVSEAVRKILFQVHCRLFTRGGQIQLVQMNVSQDLLFDLNSYGIQRKSIEVTRRRVPDVKNTMHIAYDFDWSGNDGYRRSSSTIDSKSVERFGEMIDRETCQFDLIKDESMAQKVSGYYLAMSSWPNSIYTFNMFLPHFAYELEDVVAITANFDNLNGTPAKVKSINRLFGSGKSGQINLLRFTVETIESQNHLPILWDLLGAWEIADGKATAKGTGAMEQINRVAFKGFKLVSMSYLAIDSTKGQISVEVGGTGTYQATTGNRYYSEVLATDGISENLMVSNDEFDGSLEFVGAVEVEQKVVNGYFGEGINGWSAINGSQLSYTGLLVVTGDGTNTNPGAVTTVSGLTVGKVYRVSSHYTSNSSPSFLQVGTMSGGSDILNETAPLSSAGLHDYSFTATAETVYLSLGIETSAAAEAWFLKVSLVESVNLIENWDFDNADGWTGPWSVTDGTAVCYAYSETEFLTNIALSESMEAVRVTYKVKEIQIGSVQPVVAGPTKHGLGAVRTTDGIYREVIELTETGSTHSNKFVFQNVGGYGVVIIDWVVLEAVIKRDGEWIVKNELVVNGEFNDQ